MGLTSRSGSASESGGGVVLDGDGVIGDSIGIIITQPLITAGTTRGARRFTTEATTTTVEAHVAGSMASAVDSLADAADSAIIPEQPPGLSMEILVPPEATPTPAARAASAPAPSAATTMVARREAIRRAVAPASVEVGFTAEAEGLMVVVAGGGNRSSSCSEWFVRNLNGEKRYAANETAPRQISLGQAC